MRWKSVEVMSFNGMGWAIRSSGDGVRYLHRDGTWHHNTFDENDKVFAGLYQTREAAESMMNKYKPKLTFKDLKVLERFKFNRDDRIWTKVWDTREQRHLLISPDGNIAGFAYTVEEQDKKEVTRV